MADIFNKINFNPASGQTLREAFDTIDENFSRIGGTSLLRGEDGTDWDAEVVDWDANRDMPEWAGFADAVLSAVYGGNAPVGANGDAARKCIPREVTIMRSEWEILLTPTCVADYKYAVAEGTNAAWSGEDDKSCVVSGLYDIKNDSWRIVTGESIMPRIYCDSEGDAYWMFGQYKTSIRANGVPGPAGEGDRILVARGEMSVIDGVRGVIVRKIWDASAGDNRFVDISESNSEIVPRVGTWAYAFAIDEAATPESAVTDVFMGPIDTKEVNPGEIVYFVGYDAAQSIGTLVGQFSLKRALMETGRADEAEGADALPFLFLNCGTLDKAGAWSGTGSWRFIPIHDKAAGRDILTVEHSAAPVTNDSYTEEDAEYKATGADMRITGVDGIYKECTFEPIYQKNDNLGGVSVFNDCAKFINNNINKYISESDKTATKSDLALGAEIDKAYSENVYELLLSQQKDTSIIGHYTDKPLAKFSCLKDIDAAGNGQIVQTSPETVNRDMIEALLSVIRPTGQIRVPFWDKVATASSAQNYDKFGIEQITPLDIMVINKVLYNLLEPVYKNDTKYFFDDHSADEKLKYLNDKGNKFSSVLDSIKRGLYIPVGATISLPREYVSLDPNIPDDFEPSTNEDKLLNNKDLFESSTNIYFPTHRTQWWNQLTGGDPNKTAWNNGIIHPYDLRYWAVRQFVIQDGGITGEDRAFTFFEKNVNGELQCKTIAVLNLLSTTLQPNVREWQDHTLMFTYKGITGIGASWIMEYNGMTFRIFPTDSRFDGDDNTHRYTMPFITSPASRAKTESDSFYNSMFSEATGIIPGTTYTVDKGPTIHSGRGTMEGSFKMDTGKVVAFQGMPFVVVQRIL